MIQILLLALVPLALAQYGDSGHYQDEHHYQPQPYKFGYDVKDHHGSTLERKEEGDSHGNKKGSYGYTDGHGIYRQVDYIADKNGFRATIKTNEPGTSDEDPADVHIDSNARHIEYRSEPSYKSDSRDYKSDSRDYKSDSRDYKSDSRDYKSDSRDYKSDSRDNSYSGSSRSYGMSGLSGLYSRNGYAKPMYYVEEY